MNYVGADLHKKTITLCVMNQDRKVLGRKTFYCIDPDSILEYLRAFQPFQIVVETTASYLWFAELVRPLAQRVVLANPSKHRVIAESTKKTDRLDAQTLAEFLARDMIPESHEPSLDNASTASWSGNGTTSAAGPPRSRTRSAASSAITTPTARTSSPSSWAWTTSTRSRSATPIAS